MTTEDTTGRIASTAGLGLVERLRLIAAWNRPGGRAPDASLPDKEVTCLEAADEIERLRNTLTKIHDWSAFAADMGDVLGQRVQKACSEVFGPNGRGDAGRPQERTDD